MINAELAHKIVDYLNDLLEHDRPAVAALIANRIPCNEALANHQTCQVSRQHGGYHVGLLGILNGICGTDDLGFGPIVAVFDHPEHKEDDVPGFLDLKCFRVEVNHVA